MERNFLSPTVFFLLLSLSVFADVGSGPVSTLTFNMDACTAYRLDGTNQDYSEFTAQISNSNEVSLSVEGNNLYRANPFQNGHSCTPGLNGTEAMCVTYDSSCSYIAGSERSVRFDVRVTPTGSLPAQIFELNFQELAPTMFDWIDGASGLNNYPTFYGVRVLRDGAVVFEQSANATSTDWSLETFDFSDNDDFMVTQSTVFSFELVAYCPVGAFAMQSVWDLEDINVIAGCVATCSSAPDGGTVSLPNGDDSITGCVGDIVFDVVHTTSSPINYWYVITDDNDNILAWQDSANGSTIDVSGAPLGICHIWGWSFENQPLPVPGANISTLNNDACEQISSNFITLYRTQPNGGTLTGGPFEFCVGDGIADNIPAGAITLSGNTGNNSQWVVTDDQGLILGLPPSFEAVNFDGAGAGTCLVWHLSFEDGLMGAQMGQNANNLDGCYDLSNPITVVRIQPEGGALAGGPFSFCVGDGIADNIPAGGISLSGNSGTNSQWVVTDERGDILGLPPTFAAVNFDGAGPGTCLVWHLSFESGILGVQLGANTNNLQGCYSLSNPITVYRGQPEGGRLVGGPFEFCVGDGVADNIPAGAITLSGNSGGNSQWVVTDDIGNILGLPPSFEAVNFDGAGPGTCLVWHLSFEDGLVGATMGANTSNLQGCYSLSNPVTVVRVDRPDGGTLTGGPYSFCVGDGVADNIPADGITLAGNRGSNSQWVVTDDLGNILGLPPTFSAVNFDGAGPGTCLVWHLSFEDGLIGATMGANTSNLQGLSLIHI